MTKLIVPAGTLTNNGGGAVTVNLMGQNGATGPTGSAGATGPTGAKVLLEQVGEHQCLQDRGQ